MKLKNSTKFVSFLQNFSELLYAVIFVICLMYLILVDDGNDIHVYYLEYIF